MATVLSFRGPKKDWYVIDNNRQFSYWIWFEKSDLPSPDFSLIVAATVGVIGVLPIKY